MNRNLEAFCGLYCGACPVYLKREDDWIVKTVLEQHELAFDDLHCEGCRTESLSPSCQNCAVRDCAKNQGLDSCSSCDELPCEQIAIFGHIRPHAGEVVGNLLALRHHGSEKWLANQAKQWACITCGRVGSWYERVCAECGSTLEAGYSIESSI